MFLVGFSFDPTATTWRSGSYVEGQVAMNHKGFAMGNGAVVATGNGSGNEMGQRSNGQAGMVGGDTDRTPDRDACRGD